MNTTYKTLTTDDIIQEGDEFQLCGDKWVPVFYSIGDRADARFRRPGNQVDAMTKSWHDQREELAVAKITIVSLTRRLEDALHRCRNESFYRGLVNDIGNMFGLRARITSDGTISVDVLPLKVPALVAELIIAHEDLH